MRRRRRDFCGEGLEEPIVNLTPLIDVVFVVLIMFMVIAPMMELDRVNLAQGLPQSEVMSKEQGKLLIHVKEDNSIWLNRYKVTEAQLKHQLFQLAEKDPHVIPQLFHDRSAAFGTYQIIKNALELAGYREMDVVLKPS